MLRIFPFNNTDKITGPVRCNITLSDPVISISSVNLFYFYPGSFDDSYSYDSFYCRQFIHEFRRYV